MDGSLAEQAVQPDVCREQVRLVVVTSLVRHTWVKLANRLVRSLWCCDCRDVQIGRVVYTDGLQVSCIRSGVATLNYFLHPTMGRFTEDESEDYVKRVRIGTRTVPFLLNCGYQGRGRQATHLKACVKVAERVFDKLEQLVEQAAQRASLKCLLLVNRIRAEEGKSLLQSDQFRKRMKLFDICVAPDDCVITFTANCYRDEHNFVCARFGPRGGLQDVYLE